MKNIKKLLILLSVVGSVGILAKNPKDIKIGATQIVEHPSLDYARKGFERALKDNGYADVEIEVQNAQGDFATAQLIGQGFVDKKKDMIFAISTPSAQAVYNATKDIPILITAVTDPKSAGLIGKNITGTSDALPINQQLQLAKTVFKGLKKIGLIYNTSEQNSVVSINQVKEECKKLGIEFEESGVTTVNDIAPALDNLLSKVDLIFLTTDNLVISAAALVIEKANRANKPVFAATEDQIPLGAVITQTIDYEKLGYQTGEMAVKVLKGAAPSSIPIETLKETQVLINKKVAEKYKIDLNLPELKNATVIE
ncbi:MAG: ABC transporter substrate-binding protein [Fusobacteriaceae bacterium]|jgi:putative ABC transport system substrate-binding protein|nr:ABC transporter substrate-binding protein [Fusobacteriaceae bacterium]